MKKYVFLAGMTLLLALGAAQLAWAGGYVVVAPREPVVVYVPGPFYAPVIVAEPPLLGPYGYGYGRYHHGYVAHGYPYNHYGHQGPLPSRSGICAPSGGGWGSSRGTWGRR